VRLLTFFSNGEYKLNQTRLAGQVLALSVFDLPELGCFDELRDLLWGVPCKSSLV